MKYFMHSERDNPIDALLYRYRSAFMNIIIINIFINIAGYANITFCIVGLNKILLNKSTVTLLSFLIIFIIVTLTSSVVSTLQNGVIASLNCEFDKILRPIITRHIFDGLKSYELNDTLFLLNYLDSFKDFVFGNGLLAVLSFPWIFIYVLSAFYLDFWMGFAIFWVVTFIFAYSLLKDSQHRPVYQSYLSADKAFRKLESIYIRKIDLIGEQFMESSLKQKLMRLKIATNKYRKQILISKETAESIHGFVRKTAPYTLVAIYAFAIVNNNADASYIIAASMLGSLCVNIAINFVTQFPAAREAKISYVRLRAAFADIIVPNNNFKLHRPFGKLDVSDLQISTSVKAEPILSGVNFSLSPGAAMGVIGPSGAGKSILARALIGILSPSHGTVRLDGAEMQHWDADQLGLHLGYLPQNVELLSGTIAENIARFGEVDDAAVLEAAKLAGVHDVIQGLPQGYNTQVGEGGSALSGGQRQRVGLARAIYGNPALIVLDEPNSDLDAIDESALAEALKAMKERGTTCILITHKANILKMVDFVLVLKDGTMSAFGPRDTIFVSDFVSTVNYANRPQLFGSKFSH